MWRVGQDGLVGTRRWWPLVSEMLVGPLELGRQLGHKESSRKRGAGTRCSRRRAACSDARLRAGREANRTCRRARSMRELVATNADELPGDSPRSRVRNRVVEEVDEAGWPLVEQDLLAKQT